MAGRIITTVVANAPLQKPDRSLRVYFGQDPDSRIDDDVIHTQWAWDPWPMRSGMVNDGLAAGNWAMSNRHVWVEDIRWSGVSSYVYHISGIVKDQVGAPVSGALLKLYRTADDSLVRGVVSGPDGSYSFGVPDTTTTYYVVGYRDAPAIAGTTVNTLVGS